MCDYIRVRVVYLLYFLTDSFQNSNLTFGEGLWVSHFTMPKGPMIQYQTPHILFLDYLRSNIHTSCRFAQNLICLDISDDLIFLGIAEVVPVKFIVPAR